MDFVQWLDGLGLGQYAQTFADNDIDADILPDLAEADLADLGLSLGHRKKLLRAVAALDAAPAPQATPPGRRTAERRQLTVMFCDLVGSTILSGQIDPEDFRAVMQAYQEACAEVIARFDGYIAKYLGDGILVYFGYPRAHEDDAERAVRAGLGIVDAVSRLSARPGQALQVRVGIATGLVVAGDLVGDGVSEDDAVSGETPNLAARLQAEAAPDTVVISEATHRLVAGLFGFAHLGARNLRGIEAPVEVWQATGALGIESRFEAVRARRLTPLTARTGEIELLLGRWRHAAQGEGQVMFVSGEAGIGKSRAAQTLRERVAAGPHLVLRYQCSPYHASSALYPVKSQLELAAGIAAGDDDDTRLDKLEALLVPGSVDMAEAVPVLAAALAIPTGQRYPPPTVSPEELKERTFDVLVDQLAALAADRPVLFLFEDVHWVDPTTLELLERLISNIPSLPVLMLVTSRPEFDPPWRGHSHFTALALNRLSRHDSQQMVAGVTAGRRLPAEVLEQIVAKTDGVPLFVEELTKTVLEAGILRLEGEHYVLDGPLPALAVPATLHDSLMARLDRLAEVKTVAQTGAAIGREFSRELLAAVSRHDDANLDTALQQLVDAELIFRTGAPDKPVYVFKHALVQDAAYASLLRESRRALHAELAVVIRDRFPALAEAEPETVAHHFAASDDPAAASPYWETAGRRAAAASAHIEAAEHLRRAIDTLVAGDDDARHLELGLALCASLRVLGRSEESLALLAEIEPLARSDRDKARLHHLRGNIHFVRGDADQNIAEQQAALQYARAAADAEQEMHALSGIADAEYMRGHLITSRANYEACVELARRHGVLNEAAGNFTARQHTRLLTLGPALSRDSTDESIAFLVAAEHPRAELILRTVAASEFLELGEPQAGLEQALAARAVCERIGAGIWHPSCLQQEARALRALGRQDEAERTAEEAARNVLEVGPALLGGWVLGTLIYVTSDPDRARRAIADGRHLMAKGCVGHNQLWFYRFASDACLRFADWDEAGRLADELETFTADEPMLWNRFFCARARLLAAWGRGARTPANRAALQAIATEARELGFIDAVGLVDAALAEADT